MKKELELWQFIAEHLKRKQNVMLLVVAESSGSSPGRQGFKMAVVEDELSGSIGGGVMEVNLVKLAREKLKNKEEETLLKPQVHQKNSQNPSGMICSGKQTVILYKLNSQHSAIVRQIIRLLKNHKSAVFQISPNAFQVLENQPNALDFKFEYRSEKDFLFEEKIGFKNKLFIIGGGHCALALSELMSKMDFHISLFDDRPRLNTLEKNQFVDKKYLIENYEKISEFIPAGTNHFVVVMTVGYKSDEIVIRQLLEKKFKYFGVLGSKAKIAILLKNLRKEGFPAEIIETVRTPIGLKINSRTPEEIAVSIAAEIIAVKNTKL
jgi:xanthine dehydrogenase accessory factor